MDSGSESSRSYRHLDEDLEDGEIIEEDFDEEPSQKPEPQPVNKHTEKDQKKPEPKAVNNYGGDFPLPAKRPKNNFKRPNDNWNDRPFNKDKSKKPFENPREDDFRFKKKRKKPYKEDNNVVKPAKKSRSDKGPGNAESGELDDEEDYLFVRGASPSGDHNRNSTPANSNNFDETESGDEDNFGESSIGHGRGRGGFGGRRPRGVDRRSRPPMRGVGKRRGRGGPIMRKGKHKDENQQDSICIFYMQGKCLWGDDCPYSHDANPPKKMELCKFYLMDCCAKRDKCLYMHNDFPCKYYHTNLKCFAGKNCKFSHGKLNEQLRTILIKHIETAPKEILGEFPRIGREGAIAFLKSGGVRNPALDAGPDDYRGSPNEQNNSTPVPSPSSMAPQDSDMPNFNNENYDSRYGSSNFGDDKSTNRIKSKSKKDKKWKNGKREDRHHRKEERRGEKERHRSERSKERERDKDREKDEKRSSKHSPHVDREFNPQQFYESTYGYNPNFAYEQYNQHFQGHTQENPDECENQDPQVMKHPQESVQESTQDQFCEQSLVSAQDQQSSEKSETKIEKEKVKKEKEAKEETEKEALDRSNERDEILNNMPKKQRELYLRIQQQQREAVPEAEESEPEEEPKEEENWYSSDEEEQDQKSSPLSAILRTLQFQPSSTVPQNSNLPNASPKAETPQTVPENQPPPLVIPSQFANINISDEVTKLLSSIRSQAEQNKKDESKNLQPSKELLQPSQSQLPSSSQPIMDSSTLSHPFSSQPSAPKVRDPRLRADNAFLATSQPQAKKEAHLPINIPLKRQSPENENVGMTLMDIDLRLPNPELNDPPVPVSSGGDVDLRHLPFKPAPIHQAATEIDASISSHPPIPWRLIPIHVPKIDYSNIMSSTKGGLKDPRLCRDKPPIKSNVSEDASPMNTSHHTQQPQHPPMQPQFSQPFNSTIGGMRDPRKMGSAPNDPRGQLADPRLSNSDGPGRADPRMDPRQRSGMAGAVLDPRVRMHAPNLAPPVMPGTPVYDEDSRNGFNPNFNPLMPNVFNMDSDLRQMMNPMQVPGMRPPFDGDQFSGAGPGVHDPRGRQDPRKVKEDTRQQTYGFPPNQPFDGDVDLRMNQMPHYNYSK